MATEIDNVFYQNLCGKFLIVTKAHNDIRITTDPGAQLAAVYDEIHKNVASSPIIVQVYRKTECAEDVIENVIRFDNTKWFPFGLVPFKGIRRLLPSRDMYLSNGNISVLNLHKNDYDSDKKKIEYIFKRVSENIKAVSKSGKINSHLTAGYDSRMLFSACLFSNVAVNFQTIKAPNSGARVDCLIAKKICSMYNVNHKILTFKNPDKNELKSWFERTGNCIDDAVAKLCRTVRIYDNEKYTLTGSCGEVGRAFYWKKQDLMQTNISSNEIVTRMGFKPTKLLLDQCNSWLNELGEKIERTKVLDKTYIDNRLGCWGGPSVYGHEIAKPTISPFNDSTVYQKMLSLSNDCRANNTFPKEFISLFDRRLSQIPFNRASGIRRFLFPKQEIKRYLPKNLIKILKKIKSTL